MQKWIFIRSDSTLKQAVLAETVRCVNILTYYCNNNITVSAAEICSAFLHTHTYKTEPCHKINRCCELSSVSL